MFISGGVIRSLSLTIKFPSETCGELPGALWGGGEVRLKIAVAIFLTPCY